MQVPAEIVSLSAGALFSVAGKVCLCPRHIHPRRADKEVIVVTGGGTGLGRMMAEGYVANGAKAYIVSRREEVLRAAAKEINAEFGRGAGSCVP